ncbi:ABC transporter ATP-binding protein [Rhodoligotrophos defluvii]|uniref:ABC transporter ATP-binding protein n=1 Tax=Rhodoligotrophos defluvii TaxID=2561934 RepID=UPI0010CA0017|nr:ABC transporter ATP-binding protein [Rhodoligotrophos defluvii]
MSLLRLEGVAAGYTDVDIVTGIDMYVEAREIVTIAGTNGAGKSTVIKAIMGLLKRISGSIVFDGQELTRLPVEKRVSTGISYVPQVLNVFGALTVHENLLVVEHVKNRAERIGLMYELFPALAGRRRMQAGNLSGGERQQLAFARALMSSPRLILLDEPSAALSPSLTAQVFAEVQKLPATGAAVLMVEQRARQALSFSDRGYILDSGRIVLTDTGRALLENEQMSELYLGNKDARAHH